MSPVRALPLGRRQLLALASVTLLLLAAIATAATSARAASPWWRLEARSAPTILQPGKEALVVLTATDVGDAEANGEATPIKVTDTLPKGLKVKEREEGGKKVPDVRAKTTMTNHELACAVAAAGSGGETVTCTLSKKLPTFEVIEVIVKVQVEATSGPLKNEAVIEGGGAAPTPDPREFSVGASATPFGIERYELTPENEGGSRDEQAGSHPFQLTTVLALNQALELNETTKTGVPEAPALLKDLQVKLPPGLVGDTNADAIPQCSGLLFSTIEPNGNTNACPANTAVGVAVVAVNEPITFRATHRVVPVFNLQPAPGEPARFGFEVLKVTVVLDTAVLTGENYSVVASVKDASQAAQVLGSQLTLWGQPGDAIHDESRGWNCLINGENASLNNEAHAGCALEPRPTKAFLSLPTSCSEAWESSVLADSWLEPGEREADGRAVASDPRWKAASWSAPRLSGCEKLPFSPSISVVPQTSAANSPSGLTVDVHLPQTSTLELGGLSESAVRATTVTLPEGVLLSPSAATGLEACASALLGYTGMKEFEAGSPTPTFTRHIPEARELQPGVNFCPDGSKVGVVHIKTPDLPNELEGGVYLAAQNANPFGSLFAMYIVAEDPVSKVLVKLAGEVSLNPDTGQITTSFKNTPQVPFEDLKLELFGGPRASITTPSTCGHYVTTTSFQPWSGQPAQTPSGAFDITSGPGGTACANPLPLAPGFHAGMTNNQAGGFSPFELTLTHSDTDQAPTSLSMTLPPGMAAMLSSVVQCPEPQASQGTCGPQSLIGHATATAGLGSMPFTVTGGLVYITGPYHGAPFGLTVVIPTKAGPFDFGNVVTRSTLNVDPFTAAVTINSELPTIINTASYRTGVPVQLKQIHVTVDRPSFQFNPTNCNPMTITGTLSGASGAKAPLSSRYQAATCGALPFKPVLTAQTESQFSKVEGAAFNVTVKSTPGQANIAKTKLVIPASLPSRLTTIQKACRDTVFNVNPAGCPEGSLIGHAIVHTPVLKSTLVGPAYLVSHGNAAFPDVEFVLQGEGITLILDGQTNIHLGVTTSTFNSVPDAPVSSFEAILPRGPHSALAAYLPGQNDLCAANLVVPTTITGQNGVVLQQETKVSVTGCGGVKGFHVESRAEKLKKALKACRKKHPRRKRLACERAARKKYGAKRAHHAHK